MKRIFKTVMGTFFATSMLALTHGAQAQQQQESPTQNKWFKLCSPNQEDKTCDIQFQAISDEGQLVSRVSILENRERKIKVLRVFLPTFRFVREGVTLTIDNDRSTKIPFVLCRRETCVAQASINDDFIKLFKAGGSIKISSVNVERKTDAYDMTLTGFTAAYDGDPIEVSQPANASQEESDSQNDLRKQLEQKLSTDNN